MSDRTSRSLEAQAALADGLFPHQVEGVAFLLGRRCATKEMRGVVDLLVARATDDLEASDQRSRTRLRS